MNRLPLYCAILGVLLCATAVTDCSKPQPATNEATTVNPPTGNALGDAHNAAGDACDAPGTAKKC